MICSHCYNYPMKLYMCLLMIMAFSAQASIFGLDVRKDFFEINDEKIKEMSKSFPALILKNKLKKLENGDYKLIGETLEKSWKFCADDNFADQPMNANCSATLIGKNKVLTAAHCINENKGDTFNYNNYLVVFDYKKTSTIQTEYIIPAKNVFEIQKLTHHEFTWDTMLDLAILKLKRKTDRPIIEVDLNFKVTEHEPLYVLGYPLGIPQKFADDGYITKIGRESKNSFRHNLDTFSCNSGSGIISAISNKIVGVHVRGTGSNYKKYGRTCNEWFKADPSVDFGEANLLNSLKGKI
jgi:V8-like Glu-specific endopeptidase